MHQPEPKFIPPWLATGPRRLRQRVRDASLALLYPQECRVCSRQIETWRDGVVCAACWERAVLDWQQREVCRKCGSPLRPLTTPLAPAQRECGKCRDFAFTVARAGGAYEGPLLESILWLKRHPHLPLRLRELLIAAFENAPDLQQSEAIIPVPLHATRQAERSFNQAELLAEALAAQTGLPINRASLIRAKATERHRAGMGVNERAKSLRKAFRVRAPRLLEGRAVLLVDDVMTTGSTAHEIAETLLAGGARTVNVLTLAHAVSLYL